MSLSYTPMTELEAVNDMLRMIGEAPINSIDTSGLSEATIAYAILHGTNREIQSIGLHCNSEEDYPFNPNISGNIEVPPNTLKLDASDGTVDVVIRGSRLYDRKNHTYTFLTPVNCDVTWFLPFEELPQHVRSYVAIRASRRFLVEAVGSDTLYKQTENIEFIALANFKRNELLTADISMLDSTNVKNVTVRRNV